MRKENNTMKIKTMRKIRQILISIMSFTMFLVVMILVFMIVDKFNNNHMISTAKPIVISEPEFKQFDDIPIDHWANDTIKLFKEAGFVSGYDDNTFRPSDYVTRAEFAKLLTTVSHVDIQLKLYTFADVLSNDIMYNYIESAVPYMTIWKNTDTNEYFFYPNNNIKRYDMLVTLLTMINIQPYGYSLDTYMSNYTDLEDIPEYAKSYMAYAIDKEIISGYPDNTIRGDEFITRAELCVVLKKVFIDTVHTTNYKIRNSILEFENPKPEPVEIVSNTGLPGYTDEDLEILARVMYCEAGSSWITDEQQMLYGQVLLNRVKSPEFPNTIRENAYKPRQYVPSRFERLTPDERTYNNARKLLEGYDTGMPESVVFQAEFVQGSGIWKELHIDLLGTTYLCYSENMKFYE